jgi:DNA-binding transcriptional regulator YiaG
MALDITDGERVMLGRRREGFTQEAFAHALDVSQSLISRWEANEKRIPSAVLKRYKSLGRLTVGEQCMIMRRRLNLSIREAAAKFNVSHYHVIRIEAGVRQSPEYFTFIKRLYEDKQCKRMKSVYDCTKH